MNQARTYSTKALTLSPDRPEAHNADGEVLALSGDFENALSAFHHALELDPTYWRAAFNIANAHTKQMDFERAVEYYQYTLRYTPNHSDVMTRLATLYLRSGNIELATN